jgi:hypothetical protein
LGMFSETSLEICAFSFLLHTSHTLFTRDVTAARKKKLASRIT